MQGDPPWAWSMFNSISSCGGLPRGPPPHKLPKTVRFPKVPYKEFISAVAESIFRFLGLWALIFFIFGLWCFISFHFGLLGLHFSFSASILAFGALLLAFWALRGGILWSFWPFGPSGGVSFGSLWPFEPSGGASFSLAVVHV